MREMIREKVEEYLAGEYWCSLPELHAGGTVYTVHAAADRPCIKIMAYRDTVVVCTSKDLAGRVRTLTENKSRDEIFELPLVYGQTIHYVPDRKGRGEERVPTALDSTFLFGDEIFSMRGLEGFDNSLAFDDRGHTSTRAACIAGKGDKIAGVSGAAPVSPEGLWEVGVDVLPEYRNSGMGTSLVARLTDELLGRDIVSFYSASVTNIGSQMVAARCGYIPAWVDTYGTVLDGSSPYGNLLHL